MIDFILNNTFHIGYTLTLTAMLIRDMLWLRCILLLAQLTLCYYAFSTNIPEEGQIIIHSGYYNALFSLINLYQAIVLYLQRRPRPIPDELKDIYERIFNKQTQKEFLYLWSLGEKISKKGFIIKEGETQKDLLLVLDGKADVVRDGKKIASLHRGSFIAEISFLTEEPASADVIAENSIEYISWNQNELRRIKSKNNQFWIKFYNILTHDILDKLKGQTGPKTNVVDSVEDLETS